MLSCNHGLAPVLAFLCVLLPAAAGVAAAERGAALYQQHCAACHGQELRGGLARSLLDGVWQYGAARHEVYMNIRDGLPHLGMPGFAGVLADEEMREVTDLLLAKAGEAGARRPPPPDVTHSLDYVIAVEPWIENLEVPWSLAFIDAATALVTERRGRLRLIRDGRLLPEPVVGTPAVLAEGQGGLLAVAIDPQYGQNGWIYLAYSHALNDTDVRPAPAMTRLVRGRLDGGAWTDQQTVYEAPRATYTPTRHHYGCRIVFDGEGHLLFSIGDRGRQDQAQDLGLPSGKIHRVRRDGAIPRDNPFHARPGALPTIYALGVRNSQGLAIEPATGALWATDHGPLGGDEINIIRAGRNYGWPVITYGRNYDGSVISELRAKDGLEQPILYYTPSIAVCSAAFYTGDLFARWRGRLLVTALRYEEVRLLDVKEGRVLHDQIILKNAGRVRDVAVGPDGAIYAVLNDPGTILKLTPLAER